MRRRAWILLAVLLLGGPSPASAVDVVGDDDADAYRGSGGLLLPASVPAPTREHVANCAGCQWQLTSVCNDRAEAPWRCEPASDCPGDGYRMRAWSRDSATEPWRDLGLICIARSGPVSVARVDTELRDEFVRDLPGSSISVEPPRGVLPYLPVVFDSGQPRSVPPTEIEVLGRRVVLQPIAAWHWDFGDGATLDDAGPGSRYPDLAVAHAYRTGGNHRVRVTTTWSATFTVDGLGPFTVSSPVHQQAQTVVRVGQARAVLVP